MSYQIQLQQAFAALQNGQLAQAFQTAQLVLQNQPEQPDALHLLALVARQQQNHAAALMFFKRSLQAQPKQAVVWSNYANLLLLMQHLDEAEQAYQQALTLAADFADCWANAAALALRQHNIVLALERISTALKLQPASVRFLSIKADILKASAQLQQALAVYDEALAIAPDNFYCWHNKGALLRQLDKPAEALACFANIVTQGQHSPEYHFNRACAAADCGDYCLAESEWLAALALKPDYIDAHLSLNNFYWEHQKTAQFLQSFQKSLQQQPDSAPLVYHYASRLINSQQQEAAEQVLREGLQRLGPHPELLHALGAQYSKKGLLDQAQQLTRQALAQRPDHSRFRIDLANYLMQQGDYQQALTELAKAQQTEADNQEIWAYQGTCWRLLEDPRHHWLNDYQRLVQSFLLPAPQGYDNREHFLSELNTAVRALHTSRQQPLDQSVRGGTQTIGRLLAEPARAIQDFRLLLEQQIRQYLMTLPKDNTHPLLRRNQQQFQIVGSWSVRLQQAGYHSNHVHPQGWLSACTYLEVPPAITAKDEQRQGWLKLGETCLGLGAREQVARAICPEPGLVVLFPSYTWHGTYPFSGDGSRMTAPCDISPG
ncbi:tetratricopeptide repeat protein [Rheinheimera sp.]|uniref:tetratricopeptide repeat protein n=1 Tax=Rheinheimera sp. TaxID=1869214 RepID=UPI0027B94360|nr:tetratricopeptide repeat protein [Rheinheimera sp.]